MQNTRKRLWLLALAFVGWALVARGAPTRIVDPDKLTRKQVQEYYEKLSEQGWPDEKFRIALNLCKGSRSLFDILIDLDGKKVPLRYIGRSFYTAKGAPEVVKEYWDYAVRFRFHPDEVDSVFRIFPPNAIVRWHYFAYRSGGLIDPNDKKTKRGKSYPNKECTTIFRAFRFDMNFIKRHFDERDKGTLPSKAFAGLYRELQETIKKEREEQEQKEKERKQLLTKKMEEHKEVLGLSKPKDEPEEEASAKKEKKGEYVVLSEEELAKLLQVMDREESEKTAKESEKKEEKEHAEPSEEAGESEEEAEQENEPESEGDKEQ